MQGGARRVWQLREPMFTKYVPYSCNARQEGRQREAETKHRGRKPRDDYTYAYWRRGWDGIREWDGDTRVHFSAHEN